MLPVEGSLQLVSGALVPGGSAKFSHKILHKKNSYQIYSEDSGWRIRSTRSRSGSLSNPCSLVWLAAAWSAAASPLAAQEAKSSATGSFGHKHDDDEGSLCTHSAEVESLSDRSSSCGSGGGWGIDCRGTASPSTRRFRRR